MFIFTFPTENVIIMIDLGRKSQVATVKDTYVKNLTSHNKKILLPKPERQLNLTNNERFRGLHIIREYRYSQSQLLQPKSYKL